MANVSACVEEVVDAGVPVDAFAHRLAFFFVVQADFDPLRGDREVPGVIADETCVPNVVDPPERTSIEIHRTDPESEKRQIDRLERMHATRDNAQVARLLTRLAQEAADPVTEPDADDDRAGEGPRHGWRDRPAAEGRVRELRRAAGVLTSFS